MSTTPPVLLILGAGANIGAHVARAFAEKGYKVALASRTAPTGSNGQEKKDQVHVECDLNQPDKVASVFAKVRETLGDPSVVVYNAGAHSPSPANDPLVLDPAELTRTLNINTISVLAAAHEATASFSKLPATASKTFIFTGNRLNIAPIGPMLAAGIGKAGSAHLIASAANAYKDKGYKFYYADERTSTGAPVYGNIDGPAAAEFYAELAERKDQGPWFVPFVKGVGYKDFGELVGGS